MSSLPGSTQINLDLLTVIIGCLFLFYGLTPTLVFAFGQGLLVDLFSCGFNGLFTLLYLGAFLGVHLGSRLFNLQDWKGQALLVTLVVLLKMLLFAVVMSISSTDFFFSVPLTWTVPASAFITGSIAPIFFHFSSQLWALLSPGKEEAATDPSGLRVISDFSIEESVHRK